MKWEIALRVCHRATLCVSDQQFVHNLQGNTQITKKVRQVTKSIAPPTQAIWTLPLLYERMCEWVYEVYDTRPSWKAGTESARGVREWNANGRRPFAPMIRYDEAFRLLTLPTTRGGVAGVIPNNGVKINNRYYWSNAFRNAELGNTSVQYVMTHMTSDKHAFVKGFG